MEITSKELIKVMKDNGDLFLEGAQIMFERRRDEKAKDLKNESKQFKAFAKNLESVQQKVFNVDSRKNAKVISKQMKQLEARFKKEENLSEKESEVLQYMISELKTVNTSLIKSQYSLSKSLAASTKDRLPALASILGVGLFDSPAFLFLGGVMSDMAAKRKEYNEENKKLSNEHQKSLIEAEYDTLDKKLAEEEKAAKKAEAAEKLAAKAIADGNKNTEDALSELSNDIDEANKTSKREVTEETRRRMSEAQLRRGSSEKNNAEIIDLNAKKLEVLQEHSIKLDYMGGLLNTLVAEGAASQFSMMEKEREGVRRDESLIDAIEGLGTGDTNIATEEKAKAASNLSGIFETIGGVSMFLASIGPWLSRMRVLLMGLTTSMLPVIGTVAMAYAAFEGFKGAFLGWGNAAEKLGKETATVSDKVASAAGGFLGGTMGILDKITGFFGIDTEIGKIVDQGMTEFLAGTFDFFKDFTNNVKELWTGINDWIKEKFEGVKTFLKSGKENIEEFIMDPIKVLKDIKNAVVEKGSGMIDSIGSDSYIPPSGDKADNMERVRRTLKKTGNYSDDQITGILANLKQESNFDPKALGDSGQAYGIAQWHPARQKDFQKVFGKDIKYSTIEEQAKFIDWELKNTERRAGNRLKMAQSPRAAARIFSKDFERPLLEEQEAASRANIADQMDKAQARSTDKIAETMPRSIRAEEATQQIKQDAVVKEKASSASQSNFVNAPSSTKVNNSSTSNNSYQGNVGAQNFDPTFSVMRNVFGY